MLWQILKYPKRVISINPHDFVGNREIWWNELKLGEAIELVFIDYFKASDYPIGKGHYMIYIAEAAEAYPSLEILKGDKFNFFMSYKCYLLALRRLKSEYVIPCQRKFAEGKNLYVKIEKLNTERIKIHIQEPREPTEEQIKEAEIQYNLIKKEHHSRWHKRKEHESRWQVKK